MKMTLISPPFFVDNVRTRGIPMAPTVLEYLAGLNSQVTPEIEMELVDANLTNLEIEDIQAEVVGISVLTPQAPWVYKISDKLRKRGIKTILGGIHVSALPKEAAEHADAVVIGEAESIWKEMIKDIKNNTLKKIYQGERLPLEDLPLPRTDLLKNHYPFRGFFTARGCPHKCVFCSVRKFFGDTVRHRPINEVVNELVSSKQRFLLNIDDNIWGTNIDRSIMLFKEMSENIGLKWWFGTGDLVTVHHQKADELLKWARRSGLVAVVVGWESNNPLTLKEFRAQGKQGQDRWSAVRRIREAGIDVELFIVLGSLNDKLDDYHRAIEICDSLKVSAHVVLITPYPGTELYELYQERLLPELGWDKYDGNTAVFIHDDKAMSIQNREEALLALREKIYALPRILPRVFQISLKGFPVAHFSSLFIQLQQRKAFGEFSRKLRNK